MASTSRNMSWRFSESAWTVKQKEMISYAVKPMGHHHPGSRSGGNGGESNGRRLLISLAGTLLVVILMLAVLL